MNVQVRPVPQRRSDVFPSNVCSGATSRGALAPTRLEFYERWPRPASIRLGRGIFDRASTAR